MFGGFKLIRNVGKFDNLVAAQQQFTPFTVVYAENGRGKTTLAAIFRSLGQNDPSSILHRKRLTAANDPHIVVDVNGSSLTFSSGVWSAAHPDLMVFDDEFVVRNVCSGTEVATAHRQNLHELILGSQGVALNEKLNGLVEQIETHNKVLRIKQDAIPESIRGGFTVDAFCNMKADANIDSKIEELELRISAAKASTAIAETAEFRSIGLPELDTSEIHRTLRTGLPDLQAEAASKARKHLQLLGKGGEAWVADGMARIIHTDEDGDECPFCAQPLSTSSIIEHYNAYFGASYAALRETIIGQGRRFAAELGGETQAGFERAAGEAYRLQQFWGRFTEIPPFTLDTQKIVQIWTATREAILDLLRRKAASPLDSLELTRDALAQVAEYEASAKSVAAQSSVLMATNSAIRKVKEQAASGNLTSLTADLARLKAIKKRFEPTVDAACSEYLAEKSAKAATEKLRSNCRDLLDKHRASIFPAYESALNDYLSRFGAGFRISSVESMNTRGGSSATYQMVIDTASVALVNDNGPCFRNTLSAGDRNALALAFFFSSVDLDQNAASKTIVIDDPMTSLDEGRKLTTIEELVKLSSRVRQVIVLSHERSFLCALWEEIDKNVRSAFQLLRQGTTSSLVPWDVSQDSVSMHDRRYALVTDYIATGDPSKQREVATAIRPMLEAFLRVSHPTEFPAGCLLGPFLSKCASRVGSGSEILNAASLSEAEAIKGYGNRFHHDTNPAWHSVAISDSELATFCDRTVRFISKR